MNWYLEVLKKYAVFKGRARRKEYWYFILFNTIISFVLSVMEEAAGGLGPEEVVGLLGGIYALAMLIPTLAVSVRRLHDTGRSGWWILIVLIPFIGFIVMLVFMVLDGTPGQNQYGANPKEATV